jgi:hypothetical protein
VPSFVCGPPVGSKCLEWWDVFLSPSCRSVNSISSINCPDTHLKSDNILFWFPLANKTVKPISPPQSTTSPPITYTPSPQSSSKMSRQVKTPRPNPHNEIPHSILSLYHKDVLYHAVTCECLVILSHLHSMTCYCEIT